MADEGRHAQFRLRSLLTLVFAAAVFLSLNRVVFEAVGLKPLVVAYSLLGVVSTIFVFPIYVAARERARVRHRWDGTREREERR